MLYFASSHGQRESLSYIVKSLLSSLLTIRQESSNSSSPSAGVITACDQACSVVPNQCADEASVDAKVEERLRVLDKKSVALTVAVAELVVVEEGPEASSIHAKV